MPRAQENDPPARTAQPRRRRLTDKLQQSRQSAAAKAKALQEKKNKTARRRILRERQNESNLVAEQPQDSEEVKELRAALARTRGERDAAEAAAAPAPTQRGPPPRSIARPSNMSKITVADIRDHLDLTGSENDQAWSSLRTSIRRFMDAGMLDINQGWKAQDTRRLIKVYDAIEEAHPELERFRSQWATTFLVHEAFAGQKTYKNCKGKDGTYRTRSRNQRLQASRLRRVDDDGYGGSGPRAPSHSPTPPASLRGSDGDNSQDRPDSPPVQARPSGSTRLRSLTPMSDSDGNNI
ncbi:hypothetical protein B0H16DRAFT_426071 [Mycena metata]|uniref:Uncharacterized protein n=1 Tax=Mycena metata TaxID=1033252 RepID=A0AAD7HDD0_9AGAR|nr:hypothetical protein B0H16DRAFT_426071 [Mycena metata]